MLFEQGKYYHLYNRTNNREPLFPDDENHLFFLNKVRTHLLPHSSMIAYVLMPTHFHFLVRIETDNTSFVSDEIAIMLRSYTRAINNRFDRTGNLFQQNTKAKVVNDEEYLLTLISYIHQNPLRIKLISRFEDWKYSSYRILAGWESIDNIEALPLDLAFYRRYFPTSNDFVRYSKELVRNVREEFWV